MVGTKSVDCLEYEIFVAIEECRGVVGLNVNVIVPWRQIGHPTP